jgi:hypothetical protein
MDRDALGAWLDAYQRLWRTAGTDGLADLFTEDAHYTSGPYIEPLLGLEAIAAMWEAEREGADEPFTMEREIVAVEGDTGVARVQVIYGEPKPEQYRDIWIVRLDAGGRCFRFEEWPFFPELPIVRPT